MPTTKNYGFPLYDPEDIPDLTPTGREAEAVIAIDGALKNEEDERTAGDAELNAGLEKETTERKAADKVLTDNLAKEVADRKDADTALGGRIDAEAAAREAADTALGVRIDGEVSARIEGDANLSSTLNQEIADRKAADTALGKRIDTERADRETITGDIVKQLTKETAGRESADTALGKRIDNAETEISANSADLTGIKGLTYGDNHVAFLENNNGEYDSPALQEIAEQIGANRSGIPTLPFTIICNDDGSLSEETARAFASTKPGLYTLPSGNKIIAELYVNGAETETYIKATDPNGMLLAVAPAYWYDTSGDHLEKIGASFQGWGNFPQSPLEQKQRLSWVIISEEQSDTDRSLPLGKCIAYPDASYGPGLKYATGTSGTGLSVSLDPTYLPTVSAGSGVTVTPITDGNHTKYEISSTGTGGGTGDVTVSTGTDTDYTGLTVTPTTDGNSTAYKIDLNAASKSRRGGVTIGSGLNVNPAGIISVDTSTLPTLSPSDGILIDKSTSGDRTLYTVQVKADEKTIGFNDAGELTALLTGSGGITGDTTWSELES